MWVIKQTYGELCVFYFVRCFEGFYDLFARSFVILQHPVLYLRNTRSLALNVDNKNRMKNDRRLRPVAAIHIDLIFWHLNRFYCQAQNRQDVLLSYSLSFARKKKRFEMGNTRLLIQNRKSERYFRNESKFRPAKNYTKKNSRRNGRQKIYHHLFINSLLLFFF